jgi:hypothetical protein
MKRFAFLILLLFLVPAAALAQREAPTPASPENIKAQCWMKYDKERKLSLDQRLALVEKCVQQRQAEQTGR